MWRIEERWKWFVMVMGLFGVLFIDRKIGIYMDTYQKDIRYI